MSRSDCPYEPFTCERYMFYKWYKWKSKVVWWVECVEYYQDKEGKWQVREDGTICEKNPEDWWEDWKRGLKG